MIYTFVCECGYARSVQRRIIEGPPASVACVECGEAMSRDWRADRPHVDTSLCRDHNFIPHDKRVQRTADPISKQAATRAERQFERHVNERRKLIRDAGSNTQFKQTHAIPADLYHGKIRETGDKSYWKDSKNLRKHRDCEVS